ncbi:hypothetical protein LJB99_06670, partial [Deltaproteobacteria bacterium OttesenSCG-928-K17]|nr:hypothetical protein [Deltaproteobacteria bacterium OttesenSCG-928-K17]
HLRKGNHMKISLAEINAIKADLAKLEPPLTAVREMPIKEVIMALAPELQTMVGRGFTTDGLLEVLKKRNISITGRSLNSYLKEFKESRTEVRTRGKKAAASVDGAAPIPTAARDGARSFTPSEEKDAVPPASAVPNGETWPAQRPDLTLA